MAIASDAQAPSGYPYPQCRPQMSRTTYTLREATQRLGYRRKNTVREKHLATQEDRNRLGLKFDGRGWIILDAAAVDDLASELNTERAERPDNWRVKNLGEWATPGARPCVREEADHEERS